MTYTKPEINALGDATRVIQQLFTKGNGCMIDPACPYAPLFNPAYDLDE